MHFRVVVQFAGSKEKTGYGWRLSHARIVAGDRSVLASGKLLACVDREGG